MIQALSQPLFQSKETSYIDLTLVSIAIIFSLVFNIQDHLEYPFDRVGMDDIKLENFDFDR